MQELPANAEKTAIMRVVVKENCSRDMADILFDDIMNACNELSKTKNKKSSKTKKHTKHYPIC